MGLLSWIGRALGLRASGNKQLEDNGPVTVKVYRPLEATARVNLPAAGGSAWPEQAAGRDPPVVPTVGVAFSGGGSRAFSCTAGYLRTLHAKRVLTKDRLPYIAAVSGSAWCTSAFTFHQTNVSDDELLGEYVPPESLTLDVLDSMPPLRLGVGPTQKLGDRIAEYVAQAEMDAVPYSVIWQKSVNDSILAPFKLPWDAGFTVSEAERDKILARNPKLKLITPARPDRPFLIMLASVICDTRALQLEVNTPGTRPPPYLPIDFTPLYTGYPLVRKVKYTQAETGKSFTATVGGLVESWAFSACNPPPRKIAYSGKSRSALVQTRTNGPSPFPVASIGIAAGTSSDAGSPLFQTNTKPELEGMEEVVMKRFTKGAEGPHFAAFPTAAGTVPKNTFALSDGGFTDYTPLLTLIARGVKRVIACCNSYSPLAPKEEFDVAKEGFVQGKMPSSVAAWFGQPTKAGYEANTHVFEPGQFAGVVAQLQETQASGLGAFARATLTTVRNATYGIPAGLEVEVAFFIISAPDHFVSLLPEGVRAEIDMGDIGPFRHFPYFKTEFENAVEFTQYSAKQVNLLSAYTSWVMHNHWASLEDFF